MTPLPKEAIEELRNIVSPTWNKIVRTAEKHDLNMCLFMPHLVIMLKLISIDAPEITNLIQRLTVNQRKYRAKTILITQKKNFKTQFSAYNWELGIG